MEDRDDKEISEIIKAYHLGLPLRSCDGLERLRIKDLKELCIENDLSVKGIRLKADYVNLLRDNGIKGWRTRTPTMYEAETILRKLIEQEEEDLDRLLELPDE